MIDAAIPLQTQAPQITPLLQQLNQAGNLQQQQQNLQTGAIKQESDQLTLNQQQQGAQDQSDYRAAMAAGTKIDPATGQPTLDRDSMLATLRRLNPTIAAQTASNLSQQDTAAQEAQAKLTTAQAAAVTAHLELKDRLLQGSVDEPTYQNARNIAIQNGINPNEMPLHYDPQFVAQAHAQTLSQQQAFQQQQEQAALAEKTAHDKAMTDNTAATNAATAAYRRGELNLRGQANATAAGELSLKQQQAGVGANGQPSDLATAIASGHISPARMDYLLSKNPALMQSVMQIDPTFDSSKAAAYPATYKDFTSGKTSVALNAAGTALGHLKELNDLNTVESRIPGTTDYQRYQNKLATVAPELAKFYGNDTIPGIAGYKDTLGSLFNRGAAIQTQAQSMGDKLDAYQQQWDNAAPSKAYQAPMPGISPKALAARAALDPTYKAPAQSTSAQAPARPAGVPANAVWNASGNGGQGSWRMP